MSLQKYQNRPRFGTTHTAEYDALGKFTPHSFGRTDHPPGHSKDGHNVHTYPDSAATDAGDANDSPPVPFRKEKRLRGVAKNPTFPPRWVS